MEREPKHERGGRTLPHPLPTLLLAPYLAQSLNLVSHSLLRNCTEMLAMQAIHLHTYQHGVYMFGDHSDNTGTYY